MNAYSSIVLDRAARFTADDYARMLHAGVFADAPAELIEGKLCKMSSARTRHALIHGELAGLLHAAIAGTGLRLLLDAATAISPDTVCAPISRSPRAISPPTACSARRACCSRSKSGLPRSGKTSR